MENSANKQCKVRPDVINFDDIKKTVPALAEHKKLVDRKSVV